MNDKRRLRLGFFSYLEGKDAAAVYANVREQFLAVASHGFDVAWVAQHHFGHHGGLPSPLERVAESAGRGSGLLLSRIAIGGGTTPTHLIQVPIVDLYKQKLPVEVAPRIGFSRTVYPSRNPNEAYANLAAGLNHLADA